MNGREYEDWRRVYLMIGFVRRVDANLVEPPLLLLCAGRH